MDRRVQHDHRLLSASGAGDAKRPDGALFQRLTDAEHLGDFGPLRLQRDELVVDLIVSLVVLVPPSPVKGIRRTGPRQTRTLGVDQHLDVLLEHFVGDTQQTERAESIRREQVVHRAQTLAAAHQQPTQGVDVLNLIPVVDKHANELVAVIANGRCAIIRDRKAAGQHQNQAGTFQIGVH